jgi:hypothetical protein
VADHPIRRSPPEKEIPFMSNELTKQLLDQWVEGHEASATPADPSEVAKDFGEFLKSRLNNQEK